MPEQVRVDTDIREQQSCSRFAVAPATSGGPVVPTASQPQQKRKYECMNIRPKMHDRKMHAVVCVIGGLIQFLYYYYVKKSYLLCILLQNWFSFLF